MSAWAKPGVKCVCINGGSPASAGYGLTGAFPITDQIYTIDGVSVTETGKCLLHLAEIPCAKIIDGIMMGWDAARFRPLTDKTQEQDVSMFKSLLNKTPINETA